MCINWLIQSRRLKSRLSLKMMKWSHSEQMIDHLAKLNYFSKRSFWLDVKWRKCRNDINFFLNHSFHKGLREHFWQWFIICSNYCDFVSCPDILKMLKSFFSRLISGLTFFRYPWSIRDVNFNKYQPKPSDEGGTRSLPATPANSKFATRGPQNGLRVWKGVYP